MKLFFVFYHGSWMEEGQEEMQRVYAMSESGAQEEFRNQFVRFIPGKPVVTILRIEVQATK